MGDDCWGNGIYLQAVSLPEPPPPGSMVAERSMDPGSGFPLSLVEVAVASFCPFMDFQGVLIRNQGRVSQTPLVCCWDGLEVS